MVRGLFPTTPWIEDLQAARRSEAILRDFIETSTISLHWVGADGTICGRIRRGSISSGMPAMNTLAGTSSSFTRIPVISDILACLSRGETLRDCPARLRHRDGSIRHVLINSSVLFEDGKFIHTRCFTRDVTALVEEQSTREEQRRVNALSARVGRHLIESSTLDDMLPKCAEAITAEFAVCFARIWTFSIKKRMFWSFARVPMSRLDLEGIAARIPVGSEGLGRIAAQGKPFSTNQPFGDADVLGLDVRQGARDSRVRRLSADH